MRAAAVLLAALLLGGCLATPPLPVPPQPGPVDPQPPAPVQGVPRATFAGISVGDPVAALSGLPEQDGETVFPDGTTAYLWWLDEPRPDGAGNVSWEIHVSAEGLVTYSGDF